MPAMLTKHELSLVRYLVSYVQIDINLDKSNIQGRYMSWDLVVKSGVPSMLRLFFEIVQIEENIEVSKLKQNAKTKKGVALNLI